MWCNSAVSFSFGFLVAACRIRSAACVTRARRCIRCVLWPRGFPLVPALPSVGSAGTEVPLFAALIGTMARSDCSNPFIIDSDYLLSSAAPVRRPGRIGALSGPLRGRTCVPGFLDAAEPSRPHESGRSVLPSAADTASAVNGGGIMHHARRPGGPVAAAQKCATHGPLSVATRGRRCTAWSSMRRFDWRLSTRV